MTARIIDLSLPMEPNPAQPVEVTHSRHEEGAPAMARVFGCRPEDLPEGRGWAVDTLTLSTHAGTHVDAPWHYTPVSEGRKARTIDQMPLEWFYGDGVVLDMRHKERGGAVSVDDFKAALEKIGYRLKPGDIVLVQTGTDKLWGKPEYTEAGCGMTRQSTR
jgi:kynurenine formamidase